MRRASKGSFARLSPPFSVHPCWCLCLLVGSGWDPLGRREAWCCGYAIQGRGWEGLVRAPTQPGCFLTLGSHCLV
jgi:hypothetical protein